MFFTYNKLLHKYPITTKLLTSGFLFSLGDAVSQIFIQKKKSFNVVDNLKRFIVGAMYMGPALHIWYCKALPRLQKIAFRQTTNKISRVFWSVIMTQLMFSPLLIVGFFIINEAVKNPNMNGLKVGFQDCKMKFWDTLKCNWIVWSIATGLNLWFMPIHYHVFFSNVVGFFWNIFLCFITSSHGTIKSLKSVSSIDKIVQFNKIQDI